MDNLKELFFWGAVPVFGGETNGSNEKPPHWEARMLRAGPQRPIIKWWRVTDAVSDVEYRLITDGRT